MEIGNWKLENGNSVTGRSRTSGRSPRGAKLHGAKHQGEDAKGAKHQGGGGSATDVGVLVDEGGCHRVPWATTVTVSVVRPRGGWSIPPAQGPLGGRRMMRGVAGRCRQRRDPSVER
jgi:hypothetical protein